MKEPRGKFLKIFAICLIAFLILLIFGNWRLMQARKNIFAKITLMQKEMQGVVSEKEILESKISQSQTYDYLEKVAREDLNFKKPGEVTVAFPSQNQLQESQISQKIKGLWQKFLEMRKQEKEKQ
ncbi:MAG: septum formation initiator family protein [Candidatus Pacebacteria bacterium]|nr:septum formation initiator family protein [Candidatus Paceibacterota bacterium]